MGTISDILQCGSQPRVCVLSSMLSMADAEAEVGGSWKGGSSRGVPRRGDVPREISGMNVFRSDIYFSILARNRLE